MTNERFSILYYLPGDTLSLIEIRRHDLGDEQDPGKLFHWLLLDDAGNLLERLTFVSMESTPDQQRREFAQGSLRFDREAGTYLDRATDQRHALRTAEITRVPQSHLDEISRYLDDIS